MAISPARAAAYDLLTRIEQQDAYASELLHSSHYEKLSSADHGLTTELVMGVLQTGAVTAWMKRFAAFMRRRMGNLIWRCSLRCAWGHIS